MPAQASTPSLARAKLYPPPVRDGVDRRPLVNQLASRSSSRLVCLRAGAGWGKSTLMAQWAAAEAGRRAFAWLTLDERDGEPVLFWSWVIEALRQVDPMIGSMSRPLLNAPGVDLGRELVPALVDELANLAGPVVLALDDYEKAGRDGVQSTLSLLVEQLPATVTVAIATSGGPPQSVLRRARTDLLELGPAELRFMPAETRALLRDALGLQLRDEDALRLHERTHGWPAALCLAALSLDGGMPVPRLIDGCEGNDRELPGRLVAAALAAQPAANRRFLLASSVLERMTATLCDAVLEREGSGEALESLARWSPLIVARNVGESCYSYHELLRHGLMMELARTDPEASRKLLRRAAAWHLGRGQVSEALTETVAAGDQQEASELVAEHWGGMLNLLGGDRIVERWMTSLAEQTVGADLRLCVARVYVALSLGHVEVARQWLEAAEAAPLPAPFRDGFMSARGAVASVRGLVCWQLGDVGAAGNAAREVLRREPEPSPWRGSGYAVLGLAYAAAGDWAMGRTYMQHWVEVARRAGRLAAQISGLAYGAAFATEVGDWTRAQAEADEALRIAAEHGYQEHWICGPAQFTRARLLEESGSRNQAKEAMRRALELTRRGAGPVMTTWMLTHLVRVLVACDDPAHARECLEEAREVLASAPDAAAMGGLVAAAERRIVAHAGAGVAAEPLSDRERSVLRLLATDLTQREIGAELFLSMNTVKSHVRSIFRKLGASSRDAAVARGRELDLL